MIPLTLLAVLTTVCTRRIIILKWILTLFAVIQPTYVQGENSYNSYNSHKTTGISHIPWNMLLDPNYTSHKTPSSPNRTSFSPSHYEEHSPPLSYSHQLNSYPSVKDNLNTGIYYVPPPTSHFHPNQGLKYSAPFHVHDHKPSHSFNAPVMSQRPPEKVMFPATSSFQVNRPEGTHSYPSAPQQKNKKTQQGLKDDTRKQKKRKPDEYFDLEDEEYSDSYYQDYDYERPGKERPGKERPSYRPSKQTSQSNKYKPGVDPMGLMPSASDPDGFFAKAKDILRGGSRNRPSYSMSASDYYPNYSPSKHYEEPPHGGHSYYDDQENDGYHPSNDNQYGSPGYDYEVPYGEGHYGGHIPYADKRKGSKYGPLAFALGLLPLGLLLASLVPTVVTIPVTTAVATGKRRKRSVRFVNPVLDTISEYGVAALEDPTCLNRIFCQVVRDGKQEKSSIVQKLYYKIANILDEKLAAYVGLKQLLLAVRKDECDLFQCTAKEKVAELKKED